MTASTQLSNETNHAMKVLVGTTRNASELATVQAGGKYIIGVDVNATYREYTVQVDAPGMEKFIVSTDDLCDHKRITIKEDGSKLNVQKEPRQSSNSNWNTPGASIESSTVSEKKHSWFRSWMWK